MHCYALRIIYVTVLVLKENKTVVSCNATLIFMFT